MTAALPDSVQMVDPDGTTIGTAGKLEAHAEPGILHRAISVVILDGDRTLLQRRAGDLYHFAGRWSNACCTHPRPDESPEEAARRRLTEEMGIDTGITEMGILLYEARDPESGLVETEYDHIFVGSFSGSPEPDSQLVSDWRWAHLSSLIPDLGARPEVYTPWLGGVLTVAGLDRESG